jgi:hypothetical protein
VTDRAAKNPKFGERVWIAIDVSSVSSPRILGEHRQLAMLGVVSPSWLGGGCRSGNRNVV